VVLSPGVSLPRTSLTALAEDLASRGYVVAAVDHTYEAIAITFPDGRITECLICEDRPPGPVATRSRAADISFVLDELTGRHSPWWGSRLIDPDRIAMAGHSLGGASTLATMLADGRVRAGINLDGPFLPPLETAMNRPFMMFGAEHRRPGDDESWDVTWERLTGWRRWLTVDGTDHNSVNDYGLLFDQLGVPTPDQTLPGARAAAITRAYVGAFVDRRLRQRPSRLLAGPSSRYPEVRFRP
jgi:predicted dienelactone hydrolase